MIHFSFHRTARGVLLLSLLMGSQWVNSRSILPYKNARLPLETRVQDLLHRMTLEEKVGQLRCLLGWPYYERVGNKVQPSKRFASEVLQGHVGMLWATLRADPWTQKTVETGLSPQLSAEACNALQRAAIEKTRLGIPLFFAEEAPHGHMAIGTTVFPTGIGMAATWHPFLAQQMGQVIASEIRAQGAHISYGPVLDLSRDPRWSRVEESMGEDPLLTGTMGAAVVRGLGGGELSNPHATLATLKHFIGYGTTEGGQNGNPSVLTERDLRQQFLPPFKQAVEAGALSVMTSYNSIDGIPSTANGTLYQEWLRRDWGFRGFVVSDLYSIDGIWETHHTAPTLAAAGLQALRAGVDVDLGGRAYAFLAGEVKSKADSLLVDSACARVLRCKMEMGLFEHPYVDPKATLEVRNEAHRAVALRVAEASITLLENRNATLPLRPEMKIAVLGPNADNVYNMLGDYTAPQEAGAVTTLRNAMEKKWGKERVRYAKGCAIRDTTSANISEAVRVAQWADVVVVAVGGSSARDFKTSYKATGAAEASEQSSPSDMDSGEGYDRSSLRLLGKQEELLKALRATGKPLVVVYIAGRPMDMNWAKENADALLMAYYPGEAGGEAIARVLAGEVNPAGHLPFSIPVNVGQLPVYYNHRPPVPHPYMDGTAQPAYAFGTGRSYTSFDYQHLTVNALDSSMYEVSFDLTNTGDVDGEEVAQLYIHRTVASVAQPVMQLAGFERVFLHKGETKRIRMRLGSTQLEIVNKEMKRVVEPGAVEIMVGGASDKIVLKGLIQVR